VEPTSIACNNVVVREPCGGLAFLIETLDEFGAVAQSPRQDLDGHDAVQRDLPPLVHRGHRALPRRSSKTYPGIFAAAPLFELRADALGLVDRDEAVFDEQIAEAALVGIG